MKAKHLSLIACTLLLASCTNNVDQIRLSENTKNDNPVFYATIEGNDGTPTKVYADEQLNVLWNENDLISIFDLNAGNQQYRFDGNDGDNAGTFTKVFGSDSGPELDHIYAVYPYSEATSIDNEGLLTITLPSEQTYRPTSFGQCANTMVSVTDDNQLRFRNLCSYLCLKLYGDNVSVKRITLRGNCNESLAGKAAITMPLGGVPIVEMREPAVQTVTLVCNTPVALGATAETATTFWLAIPPTTFSKGISVSMADADDGLFTINSDKELTFERNRLVKLAPKKVVPSYDYSIPEAVDLGLPSGTKWASFNLGAAAPEEAGYYYAWGETEPKGNYDWPSYKWCLYINNLLKYNASNNNGVVDDKTTLDLADDAAHVILGSSWRMPTRDEALELESYCTWTWTTLEGVPGYLIVSKQNGNSIFLPAAGYKSYKSVSYSQTSGYYWTSTLDSDCNKAKEIFISSSSNGWGTSWRSWGMPIRPVYGERVEVTGIAITSPSTTIQVASFLPLSATLTPANASDQSIVWTSSDETVAIVNRNGDVQGIGFGKATIKASANGHFAKLTVRVIPTIYETPEPVDLGLPSGLLWSSFNLGAKSPTDRGLYFAWGEVAPKTAFEWGNYKWYDRNSSSFTKYTITDNLTTLEPEDDAAHVLLGDGWRMPTKEEIEELQNPAYCTWTWETNAGTSGYFIVSKQNGNSIFLATCGYIIDNNLYNPNDYGMYWTSSLYSGNEAQGVDLYFRSANNIMSSYYNRTGGLNIRPVHEPVNP